MRWSSRFGVLGRGKMPGVALAAFALVSAAGWATTTSVGVLVPGERLDDLLSPAGETKTVAIAVLAGSELTVSCKKRGRSQVQPRFALLRPDGRRGFIDNYVKTRSGAAFLKKFPVGTTGVIRLDVETPAGSGGAYRLSTKLSGHETKWKHTGSVDESGTDTSFTFEALPLSTLKLLVKATGKPKWLPGVQVETPSGLLLEPSVAPGQTKKAKLVNLPLPELGTYVVHVSGGPGSYKLVAKVKGPNAKVRTLGFSEVAAGPEVSGVSPGSLPNDGSRVLNLAGFAFDFRHRVSLRRGGQELAGALLESHGDDDAQVRLDLRGVAPGSCDVFASGPGGDPVDTGFDVEITNAPPAIGIVVPYDVPTKSVGELEVQGSGMDPGTVITATLDADGSNIPVTLVDQAGHDRATIRLTLARYQVGPITLTAKEPNGATGTRPAALDVLGPARALGVVSSPPTAPPAPPTLEFPTSAAYSAERNAVLIATLADGDVLQFHHVDHATSQPIASGAVNQPPGTTNLGWSHSAWNPTDDKWGIVWSDFSGGRTRVHFSLHEGADVTDVIVTNQLTDFSSAAQAVGRVHIVANPDDGGWLATWVEHTNSAATLVTLPIASDGTYRANDRRELVRDPAGYVWQPCVERQSSGRYLLAYVGATDDDFFFALRTIVVDGIGRPAAGAVLASSSRDWWDLNEPVIGVRPSDGRAVVVFSYDSQDGVSHPATQPFDVNGNPTAQPRLLDLFGEAPRGRAHGVVWNQDRNEFVLSATRFDTEATVVVRRMEEDGWIKSAPEPLEINGQWGFLYAGARSGSLGMAWVHSAVDDSRFDIATSQFHVLCAPLR